MSGASSPPPLPPRVETLLAAKRLQQQSFAALHIAVLWEKAVDAAHDANVVGLSRDTSLQTAYAAGHLAALALLAAYGLQPTSAQGHHEVTFAAAAELGAGIRPFSSPTRRKCERCARAPCTTPFLPRTMIANARELGWPTRCRRFGRRSSRLTPRSTRSSNPTHATLETTPDGCASSGARTGRDGGRRLALWDSE